MMMMMMMSSPMKLRTSREYPIFSEYQQPSSQSTCFFAWVVIACCFFMLFPISTTYFPPLCASSPGIPGFIFSLTGHGPVGGLPDRIQLQPGYSFDQRRWWQKPGPDLAPRSAKPQRVLRCPQKSYEFFAGETGGKPGGKPKNVPSFCCKIWRRRTTLGVHHCWRIVKNESGQNHTWYLKSLSPVDLTS